MYKKLLLCLFIVLSFSSILTFKVSACPALSEEAVYNQPIYGDFIATLYGDEYLNYTVTDDNYVVIMGDNGYWYYAAISSCQVDGVDADQLISSGFRYKLDPVPPLAI